MTPGFRWLTRRRASGARVIVLPGGPGPDPRYLDPLIDELGRHHPIDLCRYPDDIGTITLSSMVDAIVQILGDARAHLVGHSLGALLALACAPALAPRLASLTALSPVPADGESLLDMAERSAERLASLDLAAALRLRRQRQPTTTEPELELEIFAQATRPLFARESAWLEYPYHRSDAEGFMRLADELLASGWPRQLGSIPARVLLLWGEHDVVPPAARDRLQARLRPTASLRVADAGHMLPVEQPHMVAEALARFIGL